MLLERVLDYYESDDVEMKKRRRPGSGNPTGSAFGKCAAQQVLHRYKEIGQPEEYRARTVMAFEEGDRVEEWLKATVSRLYPGLTGSAQGLTYLDVDLTDEELAVLRPHVGGAWEDPHRIWGEIRRNFEGGRPRKREDGTLVARQLNPKAGFILDPVKKKLWAPIYIDFAVKLEDIGHAVVEVKSVADGTFRRLAMGEMDASKKAQAAGMVEALGLPFIMLAYRKMTSHMLEIRYLPMATGEIQVRIMKTNRMIEEFRVAPGTEDIRTPEGKRTKLPNDQDWEIGEVWVPHDPSLLAEIRARIKGVLLWRPGDALPREAGPVFVCAKCRGLGELTCGQCHGTGKTAKLGKPCGPCKGARVVICDKCVKGLLDEAPLPPMPCSYCGCKAKCYGEPLAQTGIEEAFRLEVTEGKAPKWSVKRAAWEQAGLSFVTPPSQRRGGSDPAPAAP